MLYSQKKAMIINIIQFFWRLLYKVYLWVDKPKKSQNQNEITVAHYQWGSFYLQTTST